MQTGATTRNTPIESVTLPPPISTGVFWIVVLRNIFDHEEPAVVKPFGSWHDAQDQVDHYRRRYPLSKVETLLCDPSSNSGMEAILDLAYEEGIGKHL